MSKDMRDSPRANLGFAANMFKQSRHNIIFFGPSHIVIVKTPTLVDKI
jgi:hypothetical protein